MIQYFLALVIHIVTCIEEIYLRGNKKFGFISFYTASKIKICHDEIRN